MLNSHGTSTLAADFAYWKHSPNIVNKGHQKDAHDQVTRIESIPEYPWAEIKDHFTARTLIGNSQIVTQSSCWVTLGV